jgi:hypothetical protein
VLEHIDDDERVLAELRAALRLGGGAIVTVPQHPRLWSAADDYGRHRRRYIRSELLTKLQRCGLEAVYVTSFMMLLLPLMAASRMLGATSLPSTLKASSLFLGTSIGCSSR